MEGLWLSPEWETREVGNNEHVTAAADAGWLDKWHEDIMPEGGPDDDAYYDWVTRMINNLYNDGYVRSRYYTPNRDDEGDFVVSGNTRFVTPEAIEYLLQQHKLPKTQPITIEDGDDRTFMHRGTLSDWLEMYGKKLKPVTPQQIFMNRVSDALCKDIVAPLHLIITGPGVG